MTDMQLNPWDIAAAECVVPEAGGRVTRIRTGDKFTFAASNGHIHDDLLDIITS